MHRQSLSRVRSTVAATLILGLALGPTLSVPAMAQEGQGVIRGFLYREDEITKIGGGKVTAIDIKTGRRFDSNLTGVNGAYEITGLPAGTYDIVMDAQGVFVTNTLVDLAEGQRLTLSLARQSGSPPGRNIEGMDTPAGTAVPMTALPGAAAPGGGAGAFWRSTTGIVLLSLLGAGAVVAVVNALQDDDKKASVSAP